MIDAKFPVLVASTCACLGLFLPSHAKVIPEMHLLQANDFVKKHQMNFCISPPSHLCNADLIDVLLMLPDNLECKA